MRKCKKMLQWEGKLWTIAVMFGFGLAAYTDGSMVMISVGPVLFFKTI